MIGEQRKIYIEEHLQEPKLRIRFSVHCPESECKHIAHNITKFDLKKNLSIHISTQHPGNKGNYSIKSLATYVEDNCKQTLIPTQEQLKNTKKRKLDVPDNAYFTITCDHCSRKPQFQTLLKHNLIYNFKRHVKKEHPNIIEKQTKIYIKEHLQKPERLVRFSIHCPESECKYIANTGLKSNLKISLSRHISRKHPENKDNYSIKSLATYVTENINKHLPLHKN